MPDKIETHMATHIHKIQVQEKQEQNRQGR